MVEGRGARPQADSRFGLKRLSTKLFHYTEFIIITEFNRLLIVFLLNMIDYQIIICTLYYSVFYLHP